jgi:mitogen-activated protein kinase kinase kinase
MLLGAGAEADVFSSDGLTALKRFRKTPANWNAAVHAEITYAIEALKHPNLVRVLELDVSAGCLRMEYIDGGSLADVLLSNGALHDKHILQIITETISALCCLHENKLMHRDVKPGNIMLDSRSGASKLTDWIGNYAEHKSLQQGKPVGTPVFMAPEVAGMPHRHLTVSDTWSLGCTVINMASGRLPWADADAHGRTNEFMAMWQTSQGRAPPYDASAWNPAILAFVTFCFEPDPCRRLSAHRLRKLLPMRI